MKTPQLKTAKSGPNRFKKPTFNKSRKRLDLFNKHSKVKRMNGTIQNDRLESLKAACEQEIQETEEKLRSLRAKLNTLLTLAQESQKLSNPKSEPDKYANMGLTEAVLDVVNRLKNVSPAGATASQIRDYMIAHGFPLTEKPHNFSIAVAVTLKRLEEAGRIGSILNHDAGFRHKKTFHPLNVKK
ncbi:MAG: hypothetical protein ACLQAH_06085 [Limisphaerales bacterium]